MKRTAVTGKIARFAIAAAVAFSATTVTAHADDLSAGEPEPESIGLLLPAVQKVREATARGSSTASIELDIHAEDSSTEGRIVFTPVVVTS